MKNLGLPAVKEILHDCASYLAPVFRLNDTFSFEFELDARKHLRINYFFADRYRDYEYLNLDIDDPHSLFERASSLSLGMYGIINPEVTEKYQEYAADENRRGVEMDELEQREYEAYQTLLHIIKTCSGLAYCAARDVSGYDHLKAEEQKDERIMRRMTDRKAWKAVHNFIQRKGRKIQLADTLYRLHGEEIITRLAPLPFERARERIVTLTGVDILITDDDGCMNTDGLEPLFDRAVN